MKCTRCGTEGSPGAIFCLNCGMALPKGSVEAAPSAKTMVLSPETVPAEAEGDSGRTMVLDNVKSATAPTSSSGGETAVLPGAGSSGATTQFIPREAMAAALAQLKAGSKDQPAVEPDKGSAAKDANISAKIEEVKAEEAKVAPEVATIASPTTSELVVDPVKTEPAVEPAAMTEPIVEPVKKAPVAEPVKNEPASTPPAAAQKAVVEEPVATPVQNWSPRPKVEAPIVAAPPVAAAVTPSADANIEGTRSKLREIEADLLSYDQKLTELDQRKSALQDGLSQALSQLKSLSGSDAQSQQELDYDNLFKLVSDLAVSPRDIELISSLARRASALKRVFEIHRSAMDAVSGIATKLEPLVE